MRQAGTRRLNLSAQYEATSPPGPEIYRGFGWLIVMAVSLLAAPSARADHQQACPLCHFGSPSVSGTQPGWQPTDTSLTAISMTDHSVYASETCLSCHDGTTASASHISNDPTRTHPVGVTYRAAFHAHLRDPAESSGLGGSIGSDMLINGNVECSSYHEIHGNEPDLLIKSNERSALCLTCHDK